MEIQSERTSAATNNGGFAEPLQVAEYLKPLEVPWGICGGWALDLVLGRVTRDHSDVDIAVLRSDQHRLQTWLLDQGWTVQQVVQGQFVEWGRGESLDPRVHELWAVHTSNDFRRLEFLMNDRDGDHLIFRRDPAVRLPLERAFVSSKLGIRVLAPQLVLLYKAARAGDLKENADWRSIRSHLKPEEREWLRRALRAGYGDHSWIGAE